MRRLAQLPKEFVEEYLARPRIGLNISRRLDALYNKTKRGWKHKLLENLIEVHKHFDLRALSPEQICDIASKTRNWVGDMNRPAYKKFRKEISSVFNFRSAIDWLRKKKRIHTIFSGLRYCPYCNAETVYALNINGRSVRSDIDHFFPQSKYPFLAISLYNWIPGCTRCNRDLKRDRDIDPNKIGMPYRDDVHKGVHFDVIVNRVEGFWGCEYPDVYTVKALKESQSILSDRAAMFIDYFDTEEVYRKMYAWEIADLVKRINEVKSGYSEWLKYFLKGENVNSLIWHDIPDEEDINISRLSKLKIDILRQFKL